MEEKRFYSRKSPRMPHYDYSTENYYFVTICTHEKRCIFGLPEEKTYLGKLAAQHIREIETHYSFVCVDKFVVMPNHVHMVLVIEESQKICPENIIGQFKSGVTRDARKISPDIRLWQRSFHDHVIRNQKQYELIWTYIENNPLSWQDDCFYTSAEQE